MDAGSKELYDRDNYTPEVFMWERIMLVYAGVWGPIFLLGIFSLSDFLKSVTSFFIEHWLSNLMLPAYLYGLYLFFEFATISGGKDIWYDFTVFLILIFSAWSI